MRLDKKKGTVPVTASIIRAMPTVLIVDDERNIRATIARGLRLEGFRTVEAEHGGEALTILEEQGADVVLLDIEMPRMDGLATLEALRDRGLAVPAIVLTAHGTIEKSANATIVITFNGTATPEVVVNGTWHYQWNLDTGTAVRAGGA